MLVVVDFSSPVSGCEALGSGILWELQFLLKSGEML